MRYEVCTDNMIVYTFDEINNKNQMLSMDVEGGREEWRALLVSVVKGYKISLVPGN